MEKSTLLELKEILFTNRGNLFDFICNNYYLLTKEELKDLCKEAFALLYDKQDQENTEKGIKWNDKNYYFVLHQEYAENLTENTTILEDR